MCSVECRMHIVNMLCVLALTLMMAVYQTVEEVV